MLLLQNLLRALLVVLVYWQEQLLALKAVQSSEHADLARWLLARVFQHARTLLHTVLCLSPLSSSSDWNLMQQLHRAPYPIDGCHYAAASEADDLSQSNSDHRELIAVYLKLS